MIAEKPSWINHEGMQIFSIDIQPGGLRFATGGGDHKVRIWNMICVRGEFEGDQSTQRVLATLHDHSGSVNCVRWAKHGRYIASGSDDQMILIHERKARSGTIEFGRGEQPDVENWKVTTTLKGHTADVVDLNWSPDDSTLASASLDNTVHIWNMSNNMCTAVLRGHSSLVKGVTWDPLGCFVASQSDDKTVIFWRTGDWSLAHRTDGHWAKSLGSTFFRRLGWSPCGRFITTTHGFQKPRHSAPVLERGDWVATFDFLGHSAPIIVVKFNHSMFRRNFSNGQEEKASSVGWTKGDSKTSGKESNPYNVIAIGSQDHTITVWTTANHRPLFVAKHFFTQSVVDLSWSTDGYALFACSLDGTVATFHFEVKELGHRLSETELDGLRRNSCGDGRGRESNLAESPVQLLLEAASAKQSSSRKVLANGQNQTSVIPSGDVTIANESLSVQKISHPQIEHVRKNEVSGDGSNRVDPSVQISSPAKQRECRIANSRKRITPVAVGMPNHQEDVSGRASAQEPDLPHGASNPSKDDTRMVLAEGGLKECPVRRNGNLKENTQVGNSNYPGIQERSGVTARATLPENLIIEKVPSSSTTDGRVSVDISKSMKVSGSQNASCSALSITVYDKKGGEDSMPVRLEARRVERTTNDVAGVGNALMTNETEITCTCGAQTLWSDRMSRVTVLAGNANFWAVGCEDGGLQVYTKCGRRAMPTIMMGSAAVFIDCDECWKLLVVTRSGSIYVWDLFNATCLLHESLAPLITSQPGLSAKDSGTIKVISAKFSKSGLPLLVLATRHAFLFDTNLKCWLRIADDCFPASNFASSWNYGIKQGSELAALQVDVGKFLARKPTWNRVADDGVQTRAHLETQLASSLALKSSNEYHQCLQSYVRFLSREGDVSRLREVCESFLGPPTGMTESMSDPKNPAWDPCVLGTRKHKLLREDVLPAMATNRAVQRLLNEFMDLLSEYDNNESYLDQGQSIRDHVDSAKPATEQLDPAPSIGS